MKPWCDIYPATYLNEWRKKAPPSKPQPKPAKPTVGDRLKGLVAGKKESPDIDTELDELARHVDAYQKTRKDDLSCFSARAAALRVIAGKAERCLAIKYELREGGKAPDDYVRKVEFKAGTLDRVLKNYALQARAKADYLLTLANHYATNHRHFTTLGILEDAGEAKPSANGLVPLRSRHNLEVKDPFHRDFEIAYDDASNEFVGDSAIGCAFLEWFDALSVGKDVPHFYIWFEAHPLCLNEFDQAYRPVPSEQHPGMAPKNVHSISYTRDGLFILECNAGVVFQRQLADSGAIGEAEPFDTQNAPDSKEPGSYAYVWTENGDLIVAPHVTGTLHHSTLARGKSVRCAGMIAVKNGKVALVSNDSGHYTPPKSSLTQLVSWLAVACVFQSGARVRCLPDYVEQPVSVSEFLGGSASKAAPKGTQAKGPPPQIGAHRMAV